MSRLLGHLPERGHCFLKHRFNFTQIGDIGSHADYSYTQCCDFSNRFIRAFLVSGIADDNVGSLGGIAKRDTLGLVPFCAQC
jgi:hypothetical protein